MTVENQNSKSGPYALDGGTLRFPRQFFIKEAAHLRVIQVIDGNEVELTTGFTQTGIDDEEGEVVFTEATYPVGGGDLVLKRDIPITQETDYSNQARVRPEQVEDDLDNVVRMIQDIKEVVDRSLHLSINLDPTDQELQDLTEAGIALSGAIEEVKIVAGNIDAVNAVSDGMDAVQKVSTGIDAIKDFSGSVLSFHDKSFEATAGQYLFDVGAYIYAPENAFVWLNKVRLVPHEQYSTEGSIVQLTTPASGSDIIDVLVVSAVSSDDVFAARDEAVEAAQALKDATTVQHKAFVTVQGQRRYTVDVSGRPLGVLREAHILSGPSPFGALLYGEDYTVSDGGIDFAADVPAGSLMLLQTYPRTTNAEAQAIVTEIKEAVELISEAPTSWADFTRFGGYADGKVLWYNGAQFVRDRAMNIAALRTGPGWKPLGVPTPEHCGAAGDGFTDDTAAMLAWGTFTGRVKLRGVYRITASINVAADRVDATGSTVLYDGPPEQRVVRLTSPGSRWVRGELDANLKASVGIYGTAGGHVADGVEIHGLRSVTGQCTGAWFVSPVGSTAIRTEIYDLFAEGDGSAGDGVGPCRAVLMTSLTPMVSPCVIVDNEARDINGEEGDAFQLMVFDGTLPFGSAAWSVIKGNRVNGFNRRGVKVQASKVIVEDNILDANGGVGGFGPGPVIDVISASDVIVRGNITTSMSGMKGVQVSNTTGALLRGIVVKDNIHNGVPDSDGITMDGVTGAVLADNIQTTGRRAVFVVNSERSVVRDNVSMYGDTIGSFTDFEIASTNSRMLVDGNVSLMGSKYATLGAYAPLSSFTRTASLRDSGAIISTSAAAVSSVIDGTLAITSAGAPVAGLNEAMTTLTRTTQLGTASGTGSCNDAWVSAIPTTSRPNRYHVRGAVFWNSGTGPENGWRCTATGTPGTWAAF